MYEPGINDFASESISESGSDSSEKKLGDGQGIRIG